MTPRFLPAQPASPVSPLVVVLLLLFVFLASASIHAQATDTSSGSVEPTIENFAWLSGHWLGEQNDEATKEDGAWIEEFWGQAHQGLILGMFRQDSPRQTFYELFTLAETDTGIELRIRHFSRGLVAWEEKDETVLFTLVEVRDNHATFVDQKGTRLVYDRDGDLFVAALEKDGEDGTRRFEFRFRRAGR